MNNGRVIQAEVLDLDFTMEEYDVIPLQPDNRKYNRSKVKQETQKVIDIYYERGEEEWDL